MNDMSALNFYHYEHLFKFTKDELSLQELYLLKERCPLFDFSCYKPGVFTLPNIRKFSETFLLDNYHLLSESILELSKNKVIFLTSHPRLLRFGISSLNKLSIAELKKIDEIEDTDVFMLLEELSRSNNFKSLLNLIFSKLDIVKFLSKNFEYVFSENLRNNIIRFIKDEDSMTLISLVKKEYITSLTDLNYFINNYFACKSVFKKLDSDTLNDILIHNHILKLNIDDSNYKKYYDLKYKKVTLLLDNDLDNNKNLISRLYFNIEYKVLKETLISAKKCKLFAKYTRLLDITSNLELISFIDSIKYETNIYNKIYKTLFPITKSSIASSIKPSPSVLDGQEFSFLVHTITGYESGVETIKLADDPNLWNDSPRDDSYISTSYISDTFMGMSESKSYILGFSKVDADSILYTAPKDLYSSRKQVRNSLRNGNSSCVFPEALKLEPKMMYNEITIKRVSNGTILRPDFILSLDSVCEIDTEASKYFKVPIYLLNRMAYASKMSTGLDKCLSTDNLDGYLNLLRRMFLSFINDRKIMHKYFSESELEKSTLKIVRKYAYTTDANILRKVEEIITLYYNLVLAYNFNKDTCIEYDKKRYVNMLKKY